MKILPIILSFLAMPALANDAHWQVALGLGGSINKNETLTIHQDNGTDIRFNANFNSKPFTNPLYYGLRVSRHKDGQAWEFEHLHQKLYVDNLPSEVQHFEITDGYNLFYINRSLTLPKHGIQVRAGLGAVIAHPQITINGVETYQKGGGAIPTIWNKSSGYQWAGMSAQVGMEKSFAITDQLSLSTEAKITHSRADIDLMNGSVKVPNTALHGLVWLGYKF